jgi:integrase
VRRVTAVRNNISSVTFGGVPRLPAPIVLSGFTSRATPPTLSLWLTAAIGASMASGISRCTLANGPKLAEPDHPQHLAARLRPARAGGLPSNTRARDKRRLDASPRREIGCRRGELLALRWCDVDLEGRTLRIARSLSVSQSQRPRGSATNCRLRSRRPVSLVGRLR